MTSSTLLGSSRVTEAEVAMVPDVPFTRTFHPVHHRDVIRVVKDSITAIGMEVVKAEYVLAQNGMKMFGVYDLSQCNSELCWSIGIRNSMNRTMSVGITAGTRVFVCENLCFSGEFLAFRRHTSGLNVDELAFLAYRSMQMMIPRLTAFQAWHESLKLYHLSENELKVLMVEIIENQVIPASKFHEYKGLCSDVYDDMTLWSAHEAATDVLKGSSLLTLPQKNKRLNNLINDFIASRDEQPSVLGEFYERRAMYR